LALFVTVFSDHFMLGPAALLSNW